MLVNFSVGIRQKKNLRKNILDYIWMANAQNKFPLCSVDGKHYRLIITFFSAELTDFKSFPNALQAADTDQLEVVMEMNLSANADDNHLKGKNKAICN